MRPFRLITVERLRNRQLETAAQDLHAASAVRDQMVLVRDRLIADLAADGGVALGTFTGAELQLANNFRQILRQGIGDQNEKIAAQDEVVVQARVAWLAARGELRAVQALHERHRIAVRADQARTDQRELDEHAGNARLTRRDEWSDHEDQADHENDEQTSIGTGPR